jgi:hypothetical protein
LEIEMAPLRLLPEDEFMHDTAGVSNFNESMYFNFYDGARELGGFVRIGNRPNEGYAEQTTCLYLPDGRIAFNFGRPSITSNDAFEAGGCAFEVVTPFRELMVRYDGKVVLLDEPEAMVDPRKAFRENPWVDCSLELTYRGLSPMFGGEPVDDDGNPLPARENEFAKGHYEQHVGARGSIRLGDADWEIDAYGLRDHSWGPRFWQAPWWYRWLTGNCGEDFGFMLSIIASREASPRRGGIIFADGAYHPVKHCSIETGWRGDDHYHETITAVAATEEREYRIAGTVKSLIPLRNRRTAPDGERMVTRISEGMTEWRVEGVGTGYGLSEYLDQIVGGVPVGVGEEDGG